MFNESALFSITGLVVIIYAIGKLRKFKRVQKWEEISGTINDSTLRMHNNYGFSLNPFPKVQVEIFYEYEYREQKIKSSTIALRPLKYFSYDKAKEMRDRFKKGTEVPVFYNPQNPRQSVLIRTIRPKFKKKLVVGMVLVLFGIAYNYL